MKQYDFYLLLGFMAITPHFSLSYALSFAGLCAIAAMVFVIQEIRK